jgi:hypothetical protein
MSTRKQSRLIVKATMICFSLSLLIQIVAPVLFPVDFSGEYPIYSPDVILLIELALSFNLIGLTIMGMKAEEDRNIVAAAGFTALAISIGLAGAGLFEIAFVADLAAYEKFYYITVTSNFLYFPSLVMIGTYEKFTKWVRIAGYIASLPLLLATVLFMLKYRDFIVLETITSIGYVLFMVLTMLWAWNVYSNYKRGISAGDA